LRSELGQADLQHFPKTGILQRLFGIGAVRGRLTQLPSESNKASAVSTAQPDFWPRMELIMVCDTPDLPASSTCVH